jgi:hypothetical protein
LTLVAATLSTASTSWVFTTHVDGLSCSFSRGYYKIVSQLKLLTPDLLCGNAERAGMSVLYGDLLKLAHRLSLYNTVHSL